MSLGIHGLLLILFLFILAWREPDPPLPEYGIELNFGVSEVGTGDIQPETPPNENTSEEEAAPEEMPEETVQELEDTSDPVEESADPVEEVVEAVENTQDSPDVVQEVIKEEPRPVQEEEKKEENNKTEKTETTK